MKFKSALVAGALLLGLASSAVAEDCAQFDAVVAKAIADGYSIYVIPEANLPQTVKDVEAITGDDYGKVTRGFLGFEPGVTTVGLEANGCLYAPIRLLKPPEAGA
jgi:hypothetical protein